MARPAILLAPIGRAPAVGDLYLYNVCEAVARCIDEHEGCFERHGLRQRFGRDAADASRDRRLPLSRRYRLGSSGEDFVATIITDGDRSAMELRESVRLN